jgi:triacylglycerol lipase
MRSLPRGLTWGPDSPLGSAHGGSRQLLSPTVEDMGGSPGRWGRPRPAAALAALSPRRRLLMSGVALLAAAATAAGLIAALRPGPREPSGLPPQNRPGPVLLVPGYGGGTSALDVLAGHIRARGRVALVVRLPGTGTGSLIADAAVLNAAVNQELAHGARSVDVIGYSAGGVVALIWARLDDGVAKARRVVTLGSPFHGTRLAAGAAGLVPGACPVACQQLVPGSSLLASLRASDAAGLPHWLSLWTTDDETVTPPDSARLAGAIGVPLQSLCPTARISHSQLPTSPIVTAIVLQAIGRGPLRPPSAAGVAAQCPASS